MKSPVIGSAESTLARASNTTAATAAPPPRPLHPFAGVMRAHRSPPPAITASPTNARASRPADARAASPTRTRPHDDAPLPEVAHDDRKPSPPSRPDSSGDDDDACLSPAARSLASAIPTALAPAPALEPPLARSPSAAPSDPSDSTARAAELSAMAHDLLEQAAIWGDGQRGVARLRFSRKAGGALAGATVTLEHDGHGLRLRVEGADDAGAVESLRRKLAAKGIEVEA